MAEDSFGMIDCAVHPMPTHRLRTYMKESWRSKTVPAPLSRTFTPFQPESALR